MGKKIRLTESQFHNMIKRIVKETKHQWDEEIIEDDNDYEEMDFESNYDNMSKERRAIKKIANFLSTEVLPQLTPQQISILKRKTQESDPSMGEMNEEDEEEHDDIDSRISSRIEKGLMRGGLATAGASAVALLGEFMGYSEFEITNMLHDINHMAGLGKFTGPVGVGLVALGLAAALKGLDMRMKRTGK